MRHTLAQFKEFQAKVAREREQQRLRRLAEIEREARAKAKANEAKKAAAAKAAQFAQIERDLRLIHGESVDEEVTYLATITHVQDEQSEVDRELLNSSPFFPEGLTEGSGSKWPDSLEDIVAALGFDDKDTHQFTTYDILIGNDTPSSPTRAVFTPSPTSQPQPVVPINSRTPSPSTVSPAGDQFFTPTLDENLYKIFLHIMPTPLQHLKLLAPENQSKQNRSFNKNSDSVLVPIVTFPTNPPEAEEKKKDNSSSVSTPPRKAEAVTDEEILFGLEKAFGPGRNTQNAPEIKELNEETLEMFLLENKLSLNNFIKPDDVEATSEAEKEELYPNLRIEVVRAELDQTGPSSPLLSWSDLELLEAAEGPLPEKMQPQAVSWLPSFQTIVAPFPRTGKRAETIEEPHNEHAEENGSSDSLKGPPSPSTLSKREASPEIEPGDDLLDRLLSAQKQQHQQNNIASIPKKPSRTRRGAKMTPLLTQGGDANLFKTPQQPSPQSGTKSMPPPSVQIMSPLIQQQNENILLSPGFRFSSTQERTPTRGIGTPVSSPVRQMVPSEIVTRLSSPIYQMVPPAAILRPPDSIRQLLALPTTSGIGLMGVQQNVPSSITSSGMGFQQGIPSPITSSTTGFQQNIQTPVTSSGIDIQQNIPTTSFGMGPPSTNTFSQSANPSVPVTSVFISGSRSMPPPPTQNEQPSELDIFLQSIKKGTPPSEVALHIQHYRRTISEREGRMLMEKLLQQSKQLQQQQQPQVAGVPESILRQSILSPQRSSQTLIYSYSNGGQGFGTQMAQGRKSPRTAPSSSPSPLASNPNPTEFSLPTQIQARLPMRPTNLQIRQPQSQPGPRNEYGSSSPSPYAPSNAAASPGPQQNYPDQQMFVPPRSPFRRPNTPGGGNPVYQQVVNPSVQLDGRPPASPNPYQMLNQLLQSPRTIPGLNQVPGSPLPFHEPSQPSASPRPTTRRRKRPTPFVIEGTDQPPPSAHSFEGINQVPQSPHSFNQPPSSPLPVQASPNPFQPPPSPRSFQGYNQVPQSPLSFNQPPSSPLPVQGRSRVSASPRPFQTQNQPPQSPRSMQGLNQISQSVFTFNSQGPNQPPPSPLPVQGRNQVSASPNSFQPPPSPHSLQVFNQVPQSPLSFNQPPSSPLPVQGRNQVPASPNPFQPPPSPRPFQGYNQVPQSPLSFNQPPSSPLPVQGRSRVSASPRPFQPQNQPPQSPRSLQEFNQISQSVFTSNSQGPNQPPSSPLPVQGRNQVSGSSHPFQALNQPPPSPRPFQGYNQVPQSPLSFNSQGSNQPPSSPLPTQGRNQLEASPRPFQGQIQPPQSPIQGLNRVAMSPAAHQFANNYQSTPRQQTPQQNFYEIPGIRSPQYQFPQGMKMQLQSDGRRGTTVPLVVSSPYQSPAYQPNQRSYTPNTSMSSSQTSQLHSTTTGTSEMAQQPQSETQMRPPVSVSAAPAITGGSDSSATYTTLQIPPEFKQLQPPASPRQQQNPQTDQIVRGYLGRPYQSNPYQTIIAGFNPNLNMLTHAKGQQYQQMARQSIHPYANTEKFGGGGGIGGASGTGFQSPSPHQQQGASPLYQQPKRPKSAIGFYAQVQRPHSAVGAYRQEQQPISTVGSYQQDQRPNSAIGFYSQVQQPNSAAGQAGAYSQVQRRNSSVGSHQQVQRPNSAIGSYPQVQQPNSTAGTYPQVQRGNSSVGSYPQVQQPNSAVRSHPQATTSLQGEGTQESNRINYAPTQQISPGWTGGSLQISVPYLGAQIPQASPQHSSPATPNQNYKQAEGNQTPTRKPTQSHAFGNYHGQQQQSPRSGTPGAIKSAAQSYPGEGAGSRESVGPEPTPENIRGPSEESRRGQPQDPSRTGSGASRSGFPIPNPDDGTRQQQQYASNIANQQGATFSGGQSPHPSHGHGGRGPQYIRDPTDGGANISQSQSQTQTGWGSEGFSGNLRREGDAPAQPNVSSRSENSTEHKAEKSQSADTTGRGEADSSASANTPAHHHHPRQQLPHHGRAVSFYSQSELDAHHKRMSAHTPTAKDSEFENDSSLLSWYLQGANENIRKRQESTAHLQHGSEASASNSGNVHRPAAVLSAHGSTPIQQGNFSSAQLPVPTPHGSNSTTNRSAASQHYGQPAANSAPSSVDRGLHSLPPSSPMVPTPTNATSVYGSHAPAGVQLHANINQLSPLQGTRATSQASPAASSTLPDANVFGGGSRSHDGEHAGGAKDSKQEQQSNPTTGIQNAADKPKWEVPHLYWDDE
ncbi:unnamed protein product [Orchesella dallaii]|uniref:Uncharacterized protein n=1 Tax=Orchesella dallaii TaxID=48710 RepID=A0ABP1Q0N9_9HEXA